MSGSYFWHAHGDACDPVCILDQFAEGTFIPQPQPRPLLHDDAASVERLAAALELVLFGDTPPDADPQVLKDARAIIAALRGEG